MGFSMLYQLQVRKLQVNELHDLKHKNDNYRTVKYQNLKISNANNTLNRLFIEDPSLHNCDFGYKLIRIKGF